MNLHDVLEVHVKDIANGSAAARFGDCPRDDFVRARAGVHCFDSGKAFFEQRQNFFSRVRRQSSIDIKRTAFLQRLLVGFIDTLGMERSGQRERHEPYCREAKIWTSNTNY